MHLPRGSASFRNGRVAFELCRGRELCGKVPRVLSPKSLGGQWRQETMRST